MLLKKKVPIFILFLFFKTAGDGICRPKENDAFDAYSRMHKGEWAAARGDYSTATDCFLSVIESARLWQNFYLEAYCSMRLGDIFWNRGQLQNSIKYYEESLKIAKENEKKELIIKIENYLEIHRLYKKGRDLRDRNRLFESSESFKAALNCSFEIKNVHFSEKLLRQLVVNYLFMNDLTEAEKLNELLVHIQKHTNNKRELCNFLINLGIYYSKKSNLSTSLNNYYRALEIAEKENFVDLKAQTLTNLGTAYMDIGDWNNATKLFEDALFLDVELRNDTDIGIDLNNLGAICIKKGDYDEAAIFFMEALLFAWNRKDSRLECYLLNNLGYNFFKKKKYQESLKTYRSALKIARYYLFIELEISILCNIGSALFELGRFEDAICSFLEGINKSSGGNFNKFNWELFLGMGKCYKAKRDYKNSAKYLRAAEESVFSDLSKISEDPYRVGFLRNKSEIFSEKVDFCLKNMQNEKNENIYAEIYTAIEMAKSISLIDFLPFTNTSIDDRTSQEKQLDLLDITKRISSILSELYIPMISSVEKKKLELALVKAEGHYINMLSIHKSEENEKKIKFRFEDIATIEDIQKNILDQETCLLEYFLCDKVSILFYLSNNKAEIYFLPTKKNIEDSIRLLLNFYKDPYRDSRKTDAARGRIFKEICAPLVENKSEKKIRKIIIIPDGLLNFFPFELLNCDRENPKSFLIDRYQISYAPSASVLLYLKREAENMKGLRGFLGLGSPRSIIRDIVSQKNSFRMNLKKERKQKYNLEQEMLSPPILSTKEIIEAASHFDEEDRHLYFGAEANEEILKNMSKKEYQVVHFACHGIIDDENPIRSALLLSRKTEIEDGYLQVREIYDLSIRTNLVVLSACRSASGLVENFEGVMGLPRVFFYSGAQSVLSTLWRIEDKPTSLFMSEFFKILSLGVSKARALRIAKKKMLLTKYKNPYYWAGFILSGECESSVYFH